MKLTVQLLLATGACSIITFMNAQQRLPKQPPVRKVSVYKSDPATWKQEWLVETVSHEGQGQGQVRYDKASLRVKKNSGSKKVSIPRTIALFNTYVHVSGLEASPVETRLVDNKEVPRSKQVLAIDSKGHATLVDKATLTSK